MRLKTATPSSSSVPFQAHGGVLYLDKHGRSTQGTPVRAFCFVSMKEKDRKVEGLHFLRVGMKNYRAFLPLWAKWLQDER